MLIALLALLGVDVAVLVALLTVLLERRRWISRQPGAFRGAIRVVAGEAPELKAAGIVVLYAGFAMF